MTRRVSLFSATFGDSVAHINGPTGSAATNPSPEILKKIKTIANSRFEFNLKIRLKDGIIIIAVFYTQGDYFDEIYASDLA
jgi:hypothetical protein